MNSRPIEEQALLVHAAGMDERSQQTLQVFFERQLRGSCVLSDDRHAQAAILDFDGWQGAELMRRHLQDHPGRPLIVLALNDVGDLPPNVIFIRKPIKLDDLVEALRRLGQNEREKHTQLSSAPRDAPQTHSTHRPGASTNHGVASRDIAALHLESENTFFHIGAAPDLNLSDPEQRSRAFYDPAAYLQGHLEHALAAGLENGTGVRLSSAAFRHLDIYPKAGVAFVPIAASTLYAAGRLQMNPKHITMDYMSDVPRGQLAGERCERVEALLWKLALWASRGRVPMGTDLDWPVYLKRWPNLTRLLAPPHASRIASLWARQAYSLPLTAATLALPQRLVFGFYSACAALQLAAPTRRAADLLVVPEAPKANAKRGLFRLLLGKLMHDWGE